jgi:predicted DNA-binding transcriptional regulator YafY
MAKADRVLALLEALQDHPFASGPQLAARLGTDERTLRRDVAALRALGIPVEAERGRGGGYRLKPGYRMPPLMFTPAEATTVALGLLAAQRDGLDATGALAKLRRVLPERVRLRVEALEQTLRFTRAAREPAPPLGDSLLALAEAARRGRRVLADYTTSAGESARRELSPYGLVAHGGRWYVPAYDHGREAPRAFRADRFGAIRTGGPGRPPPDGFDAAAFVTRTLARLPYSHAIEVILHASADQVPFPPALAELEPVDGGTRLRMRADSLDWVAGLLASAGCAFTVVAPAGLRTAVHALGERLVMTP